MDKRIRVLLADAHHLVRAGLRSLLAAAAGIEIVAEAGDGRQALSLIEEHRPDVVLMDYQMPELNGLDATARSVVARPSSRVIILSMNTGEEAVLPALRAGASGYLAKDVSPAELELAIRAVARGETYLCSAISSCVVTGCLKGSANTLSSFERLTPRQREVLQLIAEGCSSKEIAKKLEISVRTAEMHRSQLMDALDIHDIAGLVRYAIRMGVISPAA
ncbi:MAG: response regulator transcription factor [Candidatus Riflebacteria bacterium]|nr:response regulator transcription factor [Candidatus Riflebacteria bacterium]